MDNLNLAQRKYYAEGIDSLLTPFELIGDERIQHYIAQVVKDKRKHLKVVED